MKAKTGNRLTKTTVDGLGRTVQVDTGYWSGTQEVWVSKVLTQYAPCGCTPVGKVNKVSRPLAYNAVAAADDWTVYAYDAIGRTVSVAQPKNAGATTYLYYGPIVKVFSPKGKWKQFENDAAGNLVNVWEPRPDAGTPDYYLTTYTYSVLGQLLTATMTRPGKGIGNGTTVTQTRTWQYSSTTQRLWKVTHPESGTTEYAYTTAGALLWKKDQKGQVTSYEYEGDTNGRLRVVRRKPDGVNEDVCQQTKFYYDWQYFAAGFAQNGQNRLTAITVGEECWQLRLYELFSYTPAGAVAAKRLRVERGGLAAVDKDVVYSYAGDGKLHSILYPDSSVPYTMSYDAMDRPIGMTGPSPAVPSVAVDHVKDVSYGAAGQLTGMKYLQGETEDGPGNWTRSYFNETRRTMTYSSWCGRRRARAGRLRTLGMSSRTRCRSIMMGGSRRGLTTCGRLHRAGSVWNINMTVCRG